MRRGEKKGEKKTQNVSFIRRSMAATLLAHSQRSADGLGFRLPRYQSCDGRTSRSIKWAAWGKGRGIKLVIRGKTKRERVQGSQCETGERQSEWSRTGSGSASSPPPPSERRRFIISGICFHLVSILSFREHPCPLKSDRFFFFLRCKRFNV